MTRPTYVVATDLSLASGRAAEVAGRLARRTGAAIEMFCALPADAVATAGIDVDRARETVDAFARRRAFDAGRPTAAHVVVARDVAGAIVRHVRRVGARLLIVAPHGATGWKRILLGSVTEEILRRASGSVLVARGMPGTEFRKILVGVVRGPEGAAALREAVALARALSAAVVVVHVVRPAELLLPLVATTHLLSTDDMARETRALSRWVATFDTTGVRVETVAVEGSPAETLVGEARRRGADLVVVGAATSSRIRRALVGSVARAVAATCAVSVLVVRGPHRRR